MDPRPDVTVVIPTRNRRSMLQEAVASVMQQSFDRWEVVVVDDASDDDTWSWLSGPPEGRVRSIRLERPSERVVARNAGLGAAKGRFLLFLDDDDRLPKGALETHVGALDSHPDAVASIGGYQRFGDPTWEGEVRIVRRRALQPILHEILFGWMAVLGQCLLRADVLRAVNGWDADKLFVEDHDLWLRMARLGPVALLPEIVLLYRVHAGQWKPDNIDQMMTEVREEAARRLPGAERDVALRILRGRALAHEGYRRYRAGRTLSAFALYAKTFLMLPSVRRSPLTRAQLPVGMLKCLVGGRATHVLRRLGRAVRRRGTRPQHEIGVAPVNVGERRTAERSVR